MIEDNIDKIQNVIKETLIKANRPLDSVKLMAVSKFHTVQEIEHAIESGVTLFGENRVQESLEKFPDILKKHPNVSLHLIGSLQRNKVKQILPYAAAIQSVDRIELIEEIQKQVKKITLEKPISLFFEYHTGEESKSGFTNFDDLCKAIELTVKNNDNLIKPVGFMTMAPFVDDKEIIRSSFIQLREIAHKAKEKFPELELNELSMGMSNDYQIAIEEGSTLVRIGTAIFGARDYNKENK